MGSGGTIWTSTLAVCLLLACGACSRQRSFVRRNGLPLRPTQGPMPVPPESAGQVLGIDASATLGGHPASGWAERTASRRSRLWSKCRETRCKLWTDYDNYYSWDVTSDLLLGVAAASVLANTSLDQDFRDWYQDDVRTRDTDHFGDAWRGFGEGDIFIPAFAGLALVGAMWDDTRCGSVLSDFGCRTTRGYLVGAPPMVFMQYCLGASRPGETKHESHWRPFDDNNAVSGHAFVGAVPFITAAKMTDSPCLKGGLYLCSTLTAWSRIDEDRHYLSQALLGWWMAYLACRAVDTTDRGYEHLTLTPVTTPDMVGVGIIYER